MGSTTVGDSVGRHATAWRQLCHLQCCACTVPHLKPAPCCELCVLRCRACPTNGVVKLESLRSEHQRESDAGDRRCDGFEWHGTRWLRIRKPGRCLDVHASPGKHLHYLGPGQISIRHAGDFRQVAHSASQIIQSTALSDRLRAAVEHARTSQGLSATKSAMLLALRAGTSTT